MKSYKHLTKEQQLDVFEKNRGLVYKIARRYQCSESLHEDMIQEGMYGLWEGVLSLDKYDPKKSKLSTFLGWYVQNRLGDFTWKGSNRSGLSACPDTMESAWKEKDSPNADTAKATLVSPALSLDAPAKDHEDTLVSNSVGIWDKYDYGLSDEIEKYLGKLCRSKRTMIEQKYGIGCEPKSRQEIGDGFGKTPKNVDAQISVGLKQIQEMPGSSALLFYLEA